MRIFLTYEVGEEVRRYLEARLPSVAVQAVHDNSAPTDEVAVIVGSSGLSGLLERLPSVRLVHIPWAGAETVVPIVRMHPGILLTNSHANSCATAQYGVAMLLALTNRLIDSHRTVAEGRWPSRGEIPPSVPLRGKTAGILGAGHIGRNAAQILAGFGMRITGMRRAGGSPSPPFEKMYPSSDLEALIAESDVLFIALPATSETAGLVGRKQFEMMHDETFLVNVGRGAIVDEVPLFEALEAGKIAGAALDVWYDYHPVSNDQGRAFPYTLPFHELPNVVLSPHRAGHTFSAPTDFDDFIENIHRLLRGRSDLVNLIDTTRGY
ncbi:MAG: 2-hydroxyacid dehydrogenase [Bacteroidota bacterium]